MRKKIIVLILVMFINVLSANATKLPVELVNYIKKDFPKAEIRFDGLITIDNTMYLPLYPAKISHPETWAIKKTVPANKTLKNLPDIVVFNSDFSLLKVIITKDGKKTVLYQSEPFEEIRHGLLPQDMLVPKGLIIPANIKTIIGGLRIATEQEQGLKIKSDLVDTPVVATTVKNDLVSSVTQLKNKIYYIITCQSKNIHVMSSDRTYPEFALSMNSTPIDLKGYDNKFLLVTAYDMSELNVVSLADEEIIKTFEFPDQPYEILVDKFNKKAYVSAPATSSIYVIDLMTMQLKQRLKVNGYCTNLYLSPGGTKIIYVDKYTNDVWSVELDNDYLLKEIGIFPNISAIAFSENKIYLTSRTKNRLAIIDYATLSEIKEIPISEKPVDMYLYYANLYILSAQNNVLQVLNTQNDKITATINLNTNNFSTKITRIDGTNLAIITGAKGGKYSVLNLDRKQIIKTIPVGIPINQIVVTNKIKKINK